MQLDGLLVAVAVFAAVTPTTAFLPTSLNFSDPELEDVFCPHLMSGESWDHKAITREALRREVRRFFLESPPPTNQSLTIPEDASLTEIFRAYYGPTSSPTRFIKAVNSITWSNAMTEASGQQRFYAPLHMDGETILQGHEEMQGRYQQLIPTILVNQAYDFARELLGTILNTIQDFYSQTTWLELGGSNASVLEGLGLPGYDIGEVAGPDDPTCTNCDDPVGECYDNVIPGSRLTSGFYEYHVVGSEGFIVPKPKSVGKCSHGGSLDSSVTTEAKGGINKETSSPCFSPHHYLHQQAVNLAISASELYLGRLRDTIGDEQFRRLLDLYPGSALSIIIDTTGSMTYELIAVKKEATLIVEKTDPELYTLVPYNDPRGRSTTIPNATDYGPVTATTDAEEFLARLNDLEAFGGCCCLEEKFWHGLQLALTNTPDYSNIYCFTDAGANDAELMEGVLALATAKHCKVSIIYSYDNGLREREEENAAMSCEGCVVSGVPEYKNLAAVTGGQFIEIDKFDIDDILGIMEDGVEESEVSLRMLDEVFGTYYLTFPIDDSITQFMVAISGVVAQANLSDSSGVSYNLMNKGELESHNGVEIVSHTDTLKFIKFANQSLGDWHLQINGAGTNFSVAVSAISTLSFLSEFCELMLEPPRPGYRVIIGRPLTAQQYYLEVTLVGYLESLVKDVTALSFVSKHGEVLSHMDYSGEVDDHFYVLSDYLPAMPFYVQVEGTIETGQQFSRIFPTMVLAVQCSVELIMEGSVTAVQPGKSGTAYFKVENFGPEAVFDYFANDERNFITGWTPRFSTLASMGSTNITVKFTVPTTAVPGTVSTVTVTASSRLHDNNINTAITYFSVLSDARDTEPPTCSKFAHVPLCDGFNSSYNCDGGIWVVQASLQDTQSGLNAVYSRPSDNLTLDTFFEGTTQPVNITFESSCCVREAEVIGRDMLGNIGKCQWNLGSLIGTVIEFVAESVGYTWAGLRWNVTEVRDDFYKYIILINHDYTEESQCKELVCRMNVTYLSPCTLQTFTLTPVYKHDGVESVGAQLDTEATTLEIVPDSPTNPAIDYVTDTSTSLSWDPPLDLSCLNYYEVCYTMFAASVAECKNTSSNSIILVDLEACTLYHVTVASVSSSGLFSPYLKFDTNTDDAAPGAPENLTVSNQTASWVELSWDDPLDRASCVDRWMITYGETEVRKSRDIVFTADNYATIYPLLACTNYTFLVSGVSPKGLQGSTKQTETSMDEIEPAAVSSMSATAVDASSVWAMWTPAEGEECVDHYLVCITDIVTLNQDCRETTTYEETFTGLVACMDYDVTVIPVSPSGWKGNMKYEVATTADLPTSPPSNYTVMKVTSHSVDIAYDPPLENPRCVVEYDTVVAELQGYKAFKKPVCQTGVSPYLEETISGLDACTDYQVQTAAVTASGFRSDWVGINFTSGEDTPSAPRSLSHIDVTTTTVTLRWYVPQMNPLCAESYQLAWNGGSENGSTEISTSDHPPEVMVMVEGLKECTSYTFTVRAVTPLGEAGPIESYSTSTLC